MRDVKGIRAQAKCFAAGNFDYNHCKGCRAFEDCLHDALHDETIGKTK